MSQALESKLIPPVLPRVVIPRLRLEPVLRDVAERRLTALVAPAGFGKSTVLGGWATEHRGAWYALTSDDRDVSTLFCGVVESLRLRLPGLGPDLGAVLAAAGVSGSAVGEHRDRHVEAHAAYLAAMLDEHLASDVVLVLDDVHEVEEGTPPARLLEALCRQAPTRLHLLVASRKDPPFPIARLQAQGQAVRVTSSTLAFAPEETEAFVAELLGRGIETPGRLHEATGGWPAAVRLAAEALRDDPDPSVLDAPVLGRRGGPVFALLAEEVFNRADPSVTELIRSVAPLDRFTAALATEALGVDDAERTLGTLEQRGLFLVPHGDDDGGYSLQPLIREFARERWLGDPAEVLAVHQRAGPWFEAHDRPREALRCRVATGDVGGIVRILTEHGRRLIAAGAAAEVAATVADLPADLRSESLVRIEGEARYALGDWDGALRCFDRLASGGPLPASVAWRMGLIHHHRGDLAAALALYEQGRVGPGDSRDRALVHAWAAAAHWLRGDLDDCRKSAEDAVDLARESDDDQALAAAHTALAMLAAMEGDRRANDAHYLRALRHAERADDVLQLIRIRTNRGSRFLEEGYYRDALAELDGAIHLADLSGYANFRALALTNRGQVLARLGRPEEGARDLEAARAAYESLDSRMIAYPLAQLGDLHRTRGETALARAAYEEAIAAAEPSGDLQGLVPALAGLALLLVDDDPEAAQRLAARSAATGPALGRARGLLAAGWVALRRGLPHDAERRAAEAAEVARGARDRATLAEALELIGRAGGERSSLEEARALWAALESPLGEARAELAMARITGGATGARMAARAERVFRQIGARALAVEAAELRSELGEAERSPIVLCELGAFRVIRDGVPVPVGAWQSRKARDLVKVLIARRGGAVNREVLQELLWPDEDPGRSASKLSVALSTARAVLDPDKRFEPEYFLAADRAALWLEHVTIDLDAFLTAAAEGLRLRGEARSEEAAELLATAEASYTGDAFEEDLYEEWAVPIREQARAAYVDVARALAEDAAAGGDHDVAARLLLRVLERDRYDERAHLALVSSLVAGGRHGDAHRAFRAYCACMEELGIEPSPYPGSPG